MDKKEKLLSDAYTEIRIVNERGIPVAVIDEYSVTPIVDGYTVALTPNFNKKDGE